MIKKTMIANSQDKALFQCDTIEHAGELWLVPQWLHNQKEGWMQPARIIRLTGLKFQDLGNDSPYGNYLLNVPIPKSVLDGKIGPEGAGQYVVVQQPDIRFPTGGIH